jgi:hypothetical protein
MADESLQVSIGEHILQCDNIDDKLRLEPVGSILAEGSTEGYRREELQSMIDTLAKYDQPDALGRLKALVNQ